MMNINCSTCLESFTSGCDISSTPCGHVFHTGCITRWLNQNDNCSQCREACEIGQIIKLYFSESQSAIEENITINDLEQKSLKLEEQSQTFERELTAIKTQCKKLEHEKLLMKLDWSKTEWNLKESINLAYIRNVDLEKEIDEQKILKMDLECNLKKSINEANKRIKDLEKEVDDQNWQKLLSLESQETTKLLQNPCRRCKSSEAMCDFLVSYQPYFDKYFETPLQSNISRYICQNCEEYFQLCANAGPAELGVKRPFITADLSPALKRNLKRSINKANKRIKDQKIVDKTNSGLESKAGESGAASPPLKRNRKDCPINIKDDERNIGNVIIDILDIVITTLDRLRTGIKLSNVLYINCEDLWEYLNILKHPRYYAIYALNSDKLENWLTLLENMDVSGGHCGQLTDKQVSEMEIDFNEALKKLSINNLLEATK